MDEMKVLLRVIESLRPDLPNVVGAEKLENSEPQKPSAGARTSEANGMQF